MHRVVLLSKNKHPWAVKRADLKMPTHAHYRVVLGYFDQVRQTDLVLVYDQSSLIGLCMQDYKCLCAAVMICATLVNIQTDIQRETHTHRQNRDQLMK